MAYVMDIFVDGGCRGNGQPWAVGAAAAVFKLSRGRQESWYRLLPNYPAPTNQRAEITAIILALQQALKKYRQQYTYHYLEVTIYSDSRYAIRCMTEWIYQWRRNGWRNYAGCGVANRDLIEKASNLDNRLKAEGLVEYVWIPRNQNEDADRICNEVMDNYY